MEQGSRSAYDGPVEVKMLDDDKFLVIVTHAGKPQSMALGRFNAFRLLAALALVLGTGMTAAMKKIKM